MGEPGLRIADCGLRIADCGLRIADCGLRIADCGLRIADCRLRIADCGLRIADCGLRIGSPARGRTKDEAPRTKLMPTTYVLGLGNVLMSDDGLGPAVLRA